MAHDYGQFTVRGSSGVEKMLTALVDEAAEAARIAFLPSEYRALVMLGGYGRGEGGVEIVNGEERPHNNLDFLLIAENPLPKKQQELRTRLVTAFGPIMRKYNIEIDVSVTSVLKLRLSPSLIIWYDMRFGHKTILGDERYVPSLEQFRLERIPARDATRLLVNRGTLILINERLLEEDQGAETERKRITRNIIKAIIGYGDALLFFLGDYHWSYVERKLRMRKREDISPVFRDLYEEAAEFRFKPDYARYQTRDLEVWLADLRAILAPLHLFCEAKRLGLADLTWEEYPKRALKHALFDEPFAARAWARKMVNFARKSPSYPDAGVAAKLGGRVLGTRNRYPLIFPVVAYRLLDPHLLRFAAATLNVASTDTRVLREAYLHLWGSEGDINAWSTLRKCPFPIKAEQDRASTTAKR